MEILKILTISVSFIFCGCSPLKKTLGVEKVAPDSFTVHPRSESLMIPPEWGKEEIFDSPLKQDSVPLSDAEKDILHRIQTLP